jgi:hypothetical protein
LGKDGNLSLPAFEPRCRRRAVFFTRAALPQKPDGGGAPAFEPRIFRINTNEAIVGFLAQLLFCLRLLLQAAPLLEKG